MAGACRKAADRAGAGQHVLTALRTPVRIAARVMWIVIVAIAATIVVTSRPADPALWPPEKDKAFTRALIVTNGFHSGMILSREALSGTALARDRRAVQQVADRFSAYSLVELGWGEERFYRNTPTIASIDPFLAARALFWPYTQTVVHVVGIEKTPEEFFAAAEMIAIDLSEEGFGRLVDSLDASFRRDTDGNVEEAGRGLYGPSLFYASTGHFSVVSDCNRWIGDRLGAAGLPTSPILSLVPATFFPSLRNAMRHAGG